MNQELATVEKSVQEIIAGLNKLKQEIKKVIVGQEEIIDQLLITFLAGGHALLEGVPGLAKTLKDHPYLTPSVLVLQTETLGRSI